ncbi:ankyrin repeat domain-containing protein, chloroplastic [Momordica charantia]|uniref:Ankyrin repeat domain-containing protein, chloroplastic n=1 Tax=Momordica charantia TaxID=3673 RepID=A0A6J1BTR0_MOMCH|nr:ankyrin repeat domain-containing protein, chloroplastic [Momordica charantia]
MVSSVLGIFVCTLIVLSSPNWSNVVSHMVYQFNVSTCASKQYYKWKIELYGPVAQKVESYGPGPGPGPNRVNISLPFSGLEGAASSGVGATMSVAARVNIPVAGVFSLLNSPLSLPNSIKLSSIPLHRRPIRVCSVSSSSHSSYSIQPDEVEEFVIGDCVIFEDGAFDDPYLSDDSNAGYSSTGVAQSKPKSGVAEIKPENLVPDEWKEAQAEINITKKERRKIAQELEFGTRVEKRKKGLVPLRSVNLEEYLAYKQAKLAQLEPLVLDNPSTFPATGEVNGAEGVREVKRGEMSGSSERVAPKNPKWAVYGRGLEDVSEFFNSGKYQPADKKSEGPRKLFTKEEKVMLNKRVPDLAAAHSEMWLPLHTLVGSGEFYLVDELLKNNVDINAVDKVGFTALHRAIIGKKQAITNYLLRESANPFVRDKDGATLMHYAVQTASSQAIKVLLLYNVDINLQDKDGWTPLHLAVQARRTDVVRLLLIKGADKTLKNAEGLTPLDLCLYSGQDTKTYELLKLLKQLPKPSKLPS